MKKVIAIFAIATLVACNNNASTEATAVDTAAKVDSVACTNCADSTAAGTVTATN